MAKKMTILTVAITIVAVSLSILMMKNTADETEVGTRRKNLFENGKEPFNREGEPEASVTKKADRIRQTGEKPKEEVLPILDALSRSNLDLAERLNISLFDENLEPNPADWEMLGLNQEDAKRLSDDLKKIFAELKTEESKNAVVLKQSDSELIVSVKKLDPERAAKHIGQLQEAFGTTFPPALSEVMTKTFISQRPSISAGLINRDRIVNVALTSDETLDRIGRNYKIQTFVIREGADLSKAADDLQNYSENTGILYVEKIPSNLNHLITQD